jgi:hypothetical protein
MTFLQLLKSITRKEWRFLFWFSLLVIALTTAPMIYGLLTAPRGATISGLHSLTPADSNVYFAYINQIKHGAIFNFNQFTTEPQTIGVFNLVWFAVGLLARIFNLSAVFAFQLARILFTPILIVAAYLLIAFFKRPDEGSPEVFKFRATALVLMILGSGWGAYFSWQGRFDSNEIYHRAADLWMPEATFFNTIFHTPHFILASALIILIFLFFLLAVENKKSKYAFIAGLLGLILFNFHPYHFPTIYLTVFIFLLALLIEKKILFKKALGYFALLVLPSSLSLLYHFYTQFDPVIAARSIQNITLSPPLVYFLIGFGAFIPLAIVGAWQYFKKPKDRWRLFLIVWCFTSFSICYLPGWQFGERNIQGTIFPLALLAADAWFYLKNKFPTIAAKLTAPLAGSIIFLVVFAPTSGYNLSRDFALFAEQTPIFYRNANERSAYSWLNNQPPANVLAAPINAIFLSAHTRDQVFLAHADETLWSERKTTLQNIFFNQKTTAAWRVAFLKQFDIKYLYWSAIEARAYPNFEPANQGFLRLVFTNKEIIIYETR